MDVNISPALPPQKDTKLEVQRFAQLAQTVLQKIKERNVTEPRYGPTFTISEAANLVGRSTSSIRTAEIEGRLPAQERTETGRRKGYTLSDLDRMREVFDTRPWRTPQDNTCVIACQNFKGGVGKSTVSVHLAQYLAIRGYRVLMVDADAQASSTMMFGLIPDTDVGVDESLIHVFRDGKIRDIIRPTHYHNLDLIPSNLHLYDAEYEVAQTLASEDPGSIKYTLMKLAFALRPVLANYDVVIMDPPPALGMVSLSVLCAATALLIPTPPSLVDFASTATFLSMLSNTLETLERYRVLPEYDFINMVVSKHGSRDVTTTEVLDMIRQIFGRNVLETNLKQSAEITHATARLVSVYDLPGPTTNYETHRRCVKQLNDMGHEVEKQILSTWHSKADLE